MNPLVQQAIDQGFGPTVTDPAVLKRVGFIASTAKRPDALEAQPTHCPTCEREIGPEGCVSHPPSRHLESAPQAPQSPSRRVS